MGYQRDCPDKPSRCIKRRAETRQSASDVAARRLGQAGAYFPVREDLAEASTATDGALWRER